MNFLLSVPMYVYVTYIAQRSTSSSKFWKTLKKKVRADFSFGARSPSL